MEGNLIPASVVYLYYYKGVAFITLTLLAGQQEGPPARKKLGVGLLTMTA